MHSNIIFTHKCSHISGNIYRDNFSVKSVLEKKAKYKFLVDKFDKLEELNYYLFVVSTSKNYGLGKIFKIEGKHINNSKIEFKESYIVHGTNSSCYDSCKSALFESYCMSGKFFLCGKLKPKAHKQLNIFLKSEPALKHKINLLSEISNEPFDSILKEYKL